MREIRCPSPRDGKHARLFAQIDRDQALLLISCSDCRATARAHYPDLAHVLHCYAVLTGNLEFSVWKWPSGQVTREGEAPLRVFRGRAS